ncbi:MAG: hypothetical protein AAGB12_03580 [Pseudomonadota bacterium]
MKLFYMNQGGHGNWGALRYSDFDILCLAENKILKSGFKMDWYSKDSLPTMSIQSQATQGRVINAVNDLDVNVQTVRPIIKFSITHLALNVVFVHLKSANKNQASEAINIAVTHVKSYYSHKPILWIGDFNRLDTDAGPLRHLAGFEILYEGGGQARWNLDRAYLTGTWGYQPKVQVGTVAAGDNGHVGIIVHL